jgi:hypothetical protein
MKTVTVNAMTVVCICICFCPARAEASVVVERFNGNLCNPEYGSKLDAAQSGAVLFDQDNNSESFAECGLITGPGLVDTTGIYSVSGRFWMFGDEDVCVTLSIHDYDSNDWCECDTTGWVYEASGAYWNPVVYYGGAGGICDDAACQSLSPGTSWTANYEVAIDDVHAGDDRIYIKAITVYAP